LEPLTAPLERLGGIIEAFRNPQGVFPAAFLSGVAAFCTFVVLLHLAWSLRSRLAAWRALDRGMSRQGVEGGEAQLLRALARCAVPQAPVNIVQNIWIFEAAVHRYLAPARRSPGRMGREAPAAALIRRLRRKLGFDARCRAVYHSTRELMPGLLIQLLFPGARKGSSAWARIADCREDYLHLTVLESAGLLVPGLEVEARFVAGSHRFAFHSRVVEVDRASGECLALHSLDIQLADRRHWRRFEINGSVAFKPGRNGSEPWRPATLWDLSPGGAKLLSSSPCPVGGRVTLRLEPASYVPANPVGPDADLGQRQIAGSVTAVEPVAGGYNHHVEFRDIENADEDYLCRLMNVIQFSRRQAAEAA